MSDVSIRVTGLAELSRAFRQIDTGLALELKTEFLRIAGRVVERAQARIPRRSGRAAGSVKPRASARGATIAFGGTAAPYFPWLDFGGSVGRGHRPGEAWSGSVRRDTPKGGRYIYPAIAASRDEIAEAVDQAVVRVAAAAGFDTRERP